MRYRRNWVPGGCFFFTVVTRRRRPLLTRADSVDVLRAAFRSVRTERPFRVDAIVVLPDHLHCIWTLPEDDADFATRWRLVKTWFTRQCEPSLRGQVAGWRAARGEQVVWQRRYWEHTVRDAEDFVRHVEYIHYNPVRHGYVGAAREWPYSSFHRYVRAGLYPLQWAGVPDEIDGVGHE
ncbi:MAG TPA: transposase [Gammaproteobacteria bacterium]|nr:transposase [Gammaproteobacteria bacterium]